MLLLCTILRWSKYKIALNLALICDWRSIFKSVAYSKSDSSLLLRTVLINNLTARQLWHGRCERGTLCHNYFPKHCEQGGSLVASGIAMPLSSVTGFSHSTHLWNVRHPSDSNFIFSAQRICSMAWWLYSHNFPILFYYFITNALKNVDMSLSVV